MDFVYENPGIAVVVLRDSGFQTPLGQFWGKIAPHRQNEQRFQKVLASVREFARHCRTMEPGLGELTPALIPAPRSQERGRSLLCKISYQNLPVGLGNCPDLSRQADSQTLCLPLLKECQLRPRRGKIGFLSLRRLFAAEREK